MKRSGHICSLLAFSTMALALLTSRSPMKERFAKMRSEKESEFGSLRSTATSADLSHHQQRFLERSRLLANYGRLPLSFESNQGQADSSVQFLSSGHGYRLLLTGDEAILSLQADQAYTQRPAQTLGEFPGIKARIPGGFNWTGHESRKLRAASSSSFRLKLLGADSHARAVGLEELPGKVNYFIGNDPKKWRTKVPTFAKVKYENVYPGVDLVYYGNQEGRLEYDFVVAPGADPNVIRMAVATNSGSPLQINSSGDLVANARSGDIHLRKPLVYQEKSQTNSPASKAREFLDSHYVLTADNHVEFEVSAYDKTKPLVIDPVLVYSTYLGGSGFDGAFAIAVDASGSMYVTGFTDSGDFPTVNPFGAFHSGSQNAFVSKLNPDGTALEYSSFLGGSANLTYSSQAGAGIAVDSSGNAYIAGYTDACDFPTVNAIQSSWCEIVMTGFVAKLNATGSALMYSTYLGGNNYNWGDWANSIAVNSLGEAFVTGSTGSTDFPTLNPVQSTLAGPINAFVTKLNASGNALVYSSYLGGRGASCFSGDTCGDAGFGIAVDSSGNTYVAGVAASPDFPTVTPIQATLAGGPWDVFVAKYNANGNALVYSTYLGGKGEDLGNSIAVDSLGSTYVVGGTGSSDFPTTKGALQETFHGGQCPSNDDTCGDAFVAKLKPDGSALIYSTYFGGSIGDIATGIAVDSSGTAHVTGFTDSTDFPVLNALQTTCASFNTGQNCPFIAQLSPDGGSLIYSTFLGGSSQSRSYGIALDGTGNAYLAGRTSATDFPTVNAFQSQAAGNIDGLVAKISNVDFWVTTAPGTPASATVTAGGTATYTLTLSPLGGFNQVVNLSCAGAPPSGTCTPSPTAVTLDGTNAANVTVTVTTMNRETSSSSPANTEWPGWPRALPLSFFLSATIAGVLLYELRRLAGRTLFVSFTTSTARVALGSLPAVMLLGLLTACGSGSSNTSRTPSGSYVLTVTGTATQGTSSLSHKATLTLIVN